MSEWVSEWMSFDAECFIHMQSWPPAGSKLESNHNRFDPRPHTSQKNFISNMHSRNNLIFTIIVSRVLFWFQLH